MADNKDMNENKNDMSKDATLKNDMQNSAPSQSLGSILNNAEQDDVFDAISFLDSMPEKHAKKENKSSKPSKSDAAGKKPEKTNASPKENTASDAAKENVPSKPAAENKILKKENAELPKTAEKTDKGAETKTPSLENASSPAKENSAADKPAAAAAKEAQTKPGQKPALKKANAEAGKAKPAGKTGKKLFSKKNDSNKNAVPAGGRKSLGKKKSLVVGILSFLLAGGAMFLFMVMQGTKDIKNADARMNFSYGNVIAEAVAPLFEALGVTDKNDEAKGIRNRLASRAPEMPLDISDWITEGKDSSSDKNGSSTASDGENSSGGYGSASAPSSEPYRKMEAALGSGGFGGGGRSQTSSNGMTSFSKGAEDDAINIRGGSASSAKGSSLPSGKKKGVEVLKASRKMLSAGLTSGSANTARGEWSAAFGEGRSSSKSGQLSGFAGSKTDLDSYKDAGLTSLDKIKSGEINDLKMSDIDGKHVSVPDAGVPAIADEANGESQKDDKASMEDVLKDAAGTAMKGAASSESNALSGSSSSGSKQNLVPPDDIKNIAEAKAPNGPWNPKTTEKMDAGDYEYYFKDSKPEYYQTPKGNWVVTYAGVETRIYKDENGKERKEKITYSDSFVLVPNVSPGYHHVFSSEKDSAGNKEEWHTSYGN